MSLFSRLFRRKPPLPDLRLPNDWRAGDLAECVVAHWYGESGPALHDICRVAFIAESRVGNGPDAGAPCYKLGLEGFDKGYTSVSFRKVRHQHELAEVEFTALIKRPVRKPVKA